MTLCNPVDCSLPGSSVQRILQVRILEWVVIFSSRYLPDLETEPTSFMSPALAGGFFTTSTMWEALITGGGGDLVLSHAQLL